MRFMVSVIVTSNFWVEGGECLFYSKVKIYKGVKGWGQLPSNIFRWVTDYVLLVQGIWKRAGQPPTFKDIYSDLRG